MTEPLELARLDKRIADLRAALVVAKRWIYEAPDNTWGYDGGDKSRARKHYALNEISLILGLDDERQRSTGGNEEVERIKKLLGDLQAAAETVAFIKEELAVSVSTALSTESGVIRIYPSTTPIDPAQRPI